MDSLTGLPTHLDLPAAWSALRGSGSAPGLTAILFDIDGLAWINYQFSSQEGDATLLRVARWLESRAEQHRGKTFRVSGDEFLLVLPEASLDDAVGLARDLVRECESLRIPYARRDDARDFLALNAVVFTASPGFETEILHWREIWADAIYAAKDGEGKAYSVVALLTAPDEFCSVER